MSQNAEDEFYHWIDDRDASRRGRHCRNDFSIEFDMQKIDDIISLHLPNEIAKRAIGEIQ